jgi:hypothetical protein
MRIRWPRACAGGVVHVGASSLLLDARRPGGARRRQDESAPLERGRRIVNPSTPAPSTRTACALRRPSPVCPWGVRAHARADARFCLHAEHVGARSAALASWGGGPLAGRWQRAPGISASAREVLAGCPASQEPSAAPVSRRATGNLRRRSRAGVHELAPHWTWAGPCTPLITSGRRGATTGNLCCPSGRLRCATGGHGPAGGAVLGVMHERT